VKTVMKFSCQLRKSSIDSLIVPLIVLYELSSYPHLLRLYWTLITLPVTSFSAEDEGRAGGEGEGYSAHFFF